MEGEGGRSGGTETDKAKYRKRMKQCRKRKQEATDYDVLLGLL